MSVAEVQTQRPQSQYIDFWNEILVPKFVRWKHIVVDGLTLHSAARLPDAEDQAGRQGDRRRLGLRRHRD